MCSRWLVVVVVAFGCSRSTSEDPLAYLPADTEAAFAVDVAAVRASPMWKHDGTRVLELFDKDLGPLRAACGFDPVTTIRSVTVAAKFVDKTITESGWFHGSTHERVVHTAVPEVIVVRGMPADKLECVATTMRPGRGITRDRGTLVQHDYDGNWAWGMVGDTLVIHIAQHTDHDTLATVIAQGAPVRDQKRFMAVYGPLDHSAPVWGATTGPLLDGLLEDNPQTMSSTLVIDDGLDWRAVLAMRDGDAAKQFAKQQDELAARVRPFVSRLDVAVVDSTVTVHVMVDNDKLAKLLALVPVMAAR